MLVLVSIMIVIVPIQLVTDEGFPFIFHLSSRPLPDLHPFDAKVNFPKSQEINKGRKRVQGVGLADSWMKCLPKNSGLSATDQKDELTC